MFILMEFNTEFKSYNQNAFKNCETFYFKRKHLFWNTTLINCLPFPYFGFHISAKYPQIVLTNQIRDQFRKPKHIRKNIVFKEADDTQSSNFESQNIRKVAVRTHRCSLHECKKFNATLDVPLTIADETLE